MGQQNPLIGALRASGGVEGLAHSWKVPWTDRGTGRRMEGYLKKIDGWKEGWTDRRMGRPRTPLMELLHGD